MARVMARLTRLNVSGLARQAGALSPDAEVDPRLIIQLLHPPGYALVWGATLSAAGLFARLGATVPTRGFHLAYSPGFRGGIP